MDRDRDSQTSLVPAAGYDVDAALGRRTFGADPSSSRRCLGSKREEAKASGSKQDGRERFSAQMSGRRGHDAWRGASQFPFPTAAGSNASLEARGKPGKPPEPRGDSRHTSNSNQTQNRTDPVRLVRPHSQSQPRKESTTRGFAPCGDELILSCQDRGRR